MRSPFALLIAAFLALSICPAQAQMAASTPVPAPKKPSFAALAFMEGTWACTSKSSRRPSPIKYTVTWAPDSSGYWLVGKSSNNGSSWFPHPSTGVDMITYDTDAKRWVDSYTDSLGNYDTSVAKGFDGNVITWHSLTTAPGPEIVSFTDSTFTKVSATKSTFSYGFTTAKGKKVTVSGSCMKS
jgi:hypothetical protein